MSSEFAHLLTCLYPRYWRERYGEEFEALLQTSARDPCTCGNVIWSALRERVYPTPGLNMKQDARFSWLKSSSVRAPWVMFGLVPLFLLAAAYCVACLILWSGWKMFLPEADTPFVRIDGFAVFYFGLGRLIYYGAPVLVGWGIAFFACRLRLEAVWPAAGLVLIALIGGTAQVHASQPSPGETGRITMKLAFASSSTYVPDFLIHSLVILSLTMVPYFLWRFQKGGSLDA